MRVNKKYPGKKKEKPQSMKKTVKPKSKKSTPKGPKPSKG